MDSQRVLYGDRPPRLIAILDEGVLRRQVGNSKVMADQAAHLDQSPGGGVRDSKDPAGPVLSFDTYTWRVFVAAPPRRT
jgi:hypothetical protein